LALIVTNNPLVQERIANSHCICYIEGTYLQVLLAVRDYIHMGHSLITHPLSGSVKPNETPYKSVIISAEVATLCLQSLSIIEESIQTSGKFPQQNIPQTALGDFMEIDIRLLNIKEVHPK